MSNNSGWSAEIEKATSADTILTLIRDRGSKGMTIGQLVAGVVSSTSLGRSEARHLLRASLRQLLGDGQLVIGGGKRYVAAGHTDLIAGTLRMLAGGRGSVQPENPSAEPINIPPHGLRGAMEGDRVLVHLDQDRRRRRAVRQDRGRTGTVTRVLERHHHELVGLWTLRGWRPLVEPLDRRLSVTVRLTDSKIDEHPAEGELVVVALDGEVGHDRTVDGTLVERLGRIDEPGVVERTVLRLYGIREHFDPEVVAEAAELAEAISETDLEGRWDLRDRPVITIDPVTARDFDDGVNAVAGSNGDIIVEVHIADVSHFVRPGTAIDREARRRGTSTYLPGVCVPMLPERISTLLCSLREGEDRLCYSVRFTVDEAGEVSRVEVHDSVIRSVRRLEYDQVYEWLQMPLQDWPDETRPFADSLALLAEAANRLRRVRSRRGSLDFELVEPELVLDETGHVTEVRSGARNQAHLLIEDLMVTANSCVAQLLLERGQPALHRVHDPPDASRIEELQALLGELGYHLKGDAADMPAANLQAVLATAAGRPEERLLSMLLLRSLSRAIYTPDPRGHYALASEAYLHFTSPIRRYPDLVCHRMLRLLQQSGSALKSPERESCQTSLGELGLACSAAEQRAESAERAAVEWKIMLYLRDHVGDTFSGCITGVTDFGLFVQVEPFLVDGMIHISELDDDYYRLDEHGHRLVGQRTHRQLRLGDPIRVRLVRVDLEAMQIQLLPADRR